MSKKYFDGTDPEALGKKEKFANRGQKAGKGHEAVGNESLMPIHEPTQIDGLDNDSASQKEGKNVKGRKNSDGKGLR